MEPKTKVKLTFITPEIDHDELWQYFRMAKRMISGHQDSLGMTLGRLCLSIRPSRVNALIHAGLLYSEVPGPGWHAHVGLTAAGDSVHTRIQFDAHMRAAAKEAEQRFSYRAKCAREEWLLSQNPYGEYLRRINND